MPRFKVVIEVEYDNCLDAEKLQQALNLKVDHAIDFFEMLDVKVEQEGPLYACKRYSKEVSQEPTVERPQEVIVCYDNETWDTHVIRAVSGQAAVDLVYDQIHNGEWSRNPAPVHVGIHREDLEEEEDEDEDE